MGQLRLNFSIADSGSVSDSEQSDAPFLTASNPGHTLGHLNCPACEKLRVSLLCSIGPTTEFTDAAKTWMDARSINAAPGAVTARYIRKSTEESYRQYNRTLSLFFDGHKLSEIHPGLLKTYQLQRLSGSEPFVRFRRPQDAKPKIIKGVTIPPKGKTPCPAKAKKVNQELGQLKRIMVYGGCWKEGSELDQMYHYLLDDEDEIPRALTVQQQRHWLDVARLKKEWNLVYWYSIIAFDTLKGSHEMRMERIGDVNLYQRIVTVPRKNAKVKSRQRTIELMNADVLWAYERLLERAASLGATEMGHFVFPGRTNVTTYDPTKPMSESGVKKSWNEVRTASGLTSFRQYDARHTGITRLAEAGVPIAVIKARAGHISQRMQDHYTHISQAAQRSWVAHAHTFHAPPSIPPQSVPMPYRGFGTGTA